MVVTSDNAVTRILMIKTVLRLSLNLTKVFMSHWIKWRSNKVLDEAFNDITKFILSYMFLKSNIFSYIIEVNLIILAFYISFMSNSVCKIHACNSVSIYNAIISWILQYQTKYIWVVSTYLHKWYICCQVEKVEKLNGVELWKYW